MSRKMIGENETSLSFADHPRVVERAMGIKCETVNCAWEESVPGRSWRSTMLLVGRGWKVENPAPSRGLIRRWIKRGSGREKIERERVVEDLNARSSDRTTFEPGVWASKELEICYVMSDDHSPVNMKKDFFGSSCRGEGEWFGGRSSLDKEVLRGLVARFWLEEEARSWTIVGMGHGARNIKRGIKETAVTYATRKSSSEKLHPSPTRNLPLQLGLSYISMTLLEYREHIFLRKKLGNLPPFLSFFTSLLNNEKNYDEMVIKRNKHKRNSSFLMKANPCLAFIHSEVNSYKTLILIYLLIPKLLSHCIFLPICLCLFLLLENSSFSFVSFILAWI